MYQFSYVDMLTKKNKHPKGAAFPFLQTANYYYNDINYTPKVNDMYPKPVHRSLCFPSCPIMTLFYLSTDGIAHLCGTPTAGRGLTYIARAQTL